MIKTSRRIQDLVDDRRIRDVEDVAELAVHEQLPLDYDELVRASVKLARRNRPLWYANANEAVGVCHFYFAGEVNKICEKLEKIPKNWISGGPA